MLRRTKGKRVYFLFGFTNEGGFKMITPTFQAKAHAKCILAGEHAVLRGCPALIFPIASKTITLSYLNTHHPAEIITQTQYEELFLTLFWGALRHSLKLLNKDMQDVHGKFLLENNIEMGAGLGFSAALCVVITRWLIWEHWVKEKKLFSFAQHMEDMFHGKSSGADVAGAISDNLVHFEQSGDIHEIKMQWQPKLYLSYSGTAKITEDAVNKVKTLNKEQPSFAKHIDEEMQESVVMIEEALKKDKQHGFNLLVSAIEEAQHCFKEWGLITPHLQEHIDKLYSLGAVAVKPTGAGGGGYVLSLWKDTPPENGSVELKALFDKAEA